MCPEGPTPDSKASSQAESKPKVKPPIGLLRDSLFDILALYEHDYQDLDGKRVHDYRCRRCAMTVRLNGLRNKVHALVRDMKDVIGEM